jgi:hypothetical protein
VSDGLFDVHYNRQPADNRFTTRGTDFMIQTAIRVVADPLKHCSDGTYPGGVPREVANAVGQGGVVDAAVGTPRWELGEPFNYLWRTASLASLVHSPDRLVEVKIYSCTINLNGMFPSDIPDHQMKAVDVETQKVVRTFVNDAKFNPSTSGKPTTLPPMDWGHQDYVVMTTSILNGCKRCITSIGMAPSTRGSAPSAEFFTAMLAQCPYHALVALPRPHADEAERKRSRWF